MSFWTPMPILVAGPCMIEDRETNLLVANEISRLAASFGLRAVFKASFDKANRSTRGSARGPGIEAGLNLLETVRNESGVKVLTDVHEVWQVELAAKTVDALQIPAFLCRQTDLLEAAGAAGLAVNIKKGQWMSADAMAGAADKVRNAGCSDLAVTERGTFLGYGDLVVDMRNFRRMRNATGAVVLFDGTHSLQRPALGPGGSSGGDRAYCIDLLKAAAGAGADGFYVETHPVPEESGSDSATMIALNDLERSIRAAVTVWEAARRERWT